MIKDKDNELRDFFTNYVINGGEDRKHYDQCPVGISLRGLISGFVAQPTSSCLMLRSLMRNLMFNLV